MPTSPAVRPRRFSRPRRFHRNRPRGLVASHCRSWGSSGFLQPCDQSRTATFLTDASPFEAFPSAPGGHRHQAIAGLFTECSRPSRGWPSSVLRTGRNLHAIEKSPPPQGLPDAESVALEPRCRDHRARCSLGFLFHDSRLSPVDLTGADAMSKQCVLVFGRPVRRQGPSRPRTRRSGSTVPMTSSTPSLSSSLLPPKRASRTRRASRPCTWSNHMPPRSKLRAGALAFRTTPLPMQP